MKKFYIGLFLFLGLIKINVFAQSLKVVDRQESSVELTSFSYEDPDFKSNDWIGVYNTGDDPATVQSVAWKYVTSEKGILTLDETLPAGTFEAYLFCCDGSEPENVIAKSAVFISDGEVVTSSLRSSATIYIQNSPILFNYQSSDFGSTDWIGIYNDNGEGPGSDNPSIDWMYIPGDSGTVTMETQLEPGDYVAYLLCCDGYDIKAQCNFSISDGTTKIVDATSFTFTSTDSLKFIYIDPDFSATDWIGIYNPEDVPGEVNSILWSYISDSEGTASFENTLESGEYWIGLFCCDGYDLYSKAIFFVVEGTPVAVNSINLEKETLWIFPNPSNGQFNIKSTTGTKLQQVDVFNIEGRLMYSAELGFADSNFSIDLSGLKQGNYVLKARSEKSSFATKIIIQK